MDPDIRRDDTAMLPKTKRLNLKTDFKWVASGKKIDTKFVRLFVKMGDPSTHSINTQGRTEWNRSTTRSARSGPLVGIAVSSKSFKKATQRNRAKRLTSVALESLYPLLPSRLNIVALPKTAIIGVKSQDVLLDLMKCYEKNTDWFN